jgi:hypothetical protein
MFDVSTAEKTSYYMPVTTWEEAKKYSECRLLYVDDPFYPRESWKNEAGWVAEHGERAFLGDIHYGYKFAVLVEDE